MTVLALDMATKTGWAFWDGQKTTSGIQDFSLKRGDSRGMRYLRFEAWLKSIEALVSPIDLITWEQSHHRGGAATEVAHGFKTRLEGFMSQLPKHPETTMVHSATIKKHALGTGRGSKEAMVEAAINHGWEPEDDNEADALWLLDYVLKDLKII